MRCEDVVRELAAPRTLEGPSAPMAAHLAACPRCADWSRLAARLDRAWEATRPAPPSPEALDTLWARASAAIDAESARVKDKVIPFRRPAARRRWPIVALVAAQAAAALVAATAWLRSAPGPAPAPTILAGPVTVGVDQTVVVRIVDDGHQVEVLDDSGQFALSSMADATPHDVFSAVESMVAQ